MAAVRNGDRRASPDGGLTYGPQESAASWSIYTEMERVAKSARVENGCKCCGGVPTYLTPEGLRCREHLHGDEDWDDWIPLARKDSRQRHRRLIGRQPT
jgi:hypothetical protein